ncbi:MAG: hypothetical protein J3K34DRAFT_403351 [Monoraphidium minutum]|nr:MAG: hypothetical protein J3K34DRAFT_403351 [Monoraphidium minutum]
MSAMEQLLSYKKQLEEDLVRVEASIADMELKFFQADHAAVASCIKGFEAHLSSKEALRKRALRSWKPEDRWFSLSSTSSPVAMEMAEQEATEPALQGGFGKKGYPPAKVAYPQKGKR